MPTGRSGPVQEFAGLLEPELRETADRVKAVAEGLDERPLGLLARHFVDVDTTSFSYSDADGIVVPRSAGRGRGAYLRPSHDFVFPT
jgi:hypothetical protein